MSEVQLLIIVGIQRAGCKEGNEVWHRAAIAEDERWFALTRIYNCSFDNQVSQNYWHLAELDWDCEFGCTKIWGLIWYYPNLKPDAKGEVGEQSFALASRAGEFPSAPEIM